MRVALVEGADAATNTQVVGVDPDSIVSNLLTSDHIWQTPSCPLSSENAANVHRGPIEEKYSQKSLPIFLS